MTVLTRDLNVVSCGSAVLLAAVLSSVSACHGDTPSEPLPAAASAEEPASSAPHVREAHRIVFQDHRHILPLRVDDLLLLPDDAAFEWKIEFEDKSAAERATDAGAAGEAYRMTKPGPFRAMVFGDPKACMHSDAACTISKRRWDITLAVK
jgi:hypothetical protein